MRGLALVCMVVALVALGGPFAAAGTEAGREQADPGLEKRIERLEGDVSRLKGGAEAEKPAMRSKYAVDLYGFLKLDLAYMDSRANDAGNYARWIESEQDNRNDNQFNITARESRFGLMLKGPDVRTMKTSGRVEIDFYEGGAENKNRPMMRHAYLQVEWPESGWSILAGQTSDVVSPLVPETLNYSVGWWIGNIGYRRPQLRVSRSFEVGSGVGVLLQAALARTIGHFGAFSPSQDSGKDAGFPTVQGRWAMSFPVSGLDKITVGVSGHWAEEEYDRDAEGSHSHLESWSVNVDLSVPILRWLSFRGEVWGGENLDQYLGGVGQGVVIETTDGAFLNGENIKGAFVRQWSVASLGGWGCMICGPWNGWRLNFGYSVDNPRDRDVISGQGRTWNNSYWGQVSYDLNEAVRVGVELSWWETAYKNQEDGDALRLQTSFVYRF